MQIFSEDHADHAGTFYGLRQQAARDPVLPSDKPLKTAGCSLFASLTADPFVQVFSDEERADHAGTFYGLRQQAEKNAPDSASARLSCRHTYV